MPDVETWKFINTFAPWFSAGGTIAAVITSLFLAMRDRRIRLRVNAGIRVIVEHGNPQFRQEIVFLSVTNVGHRSARVTTFYWRCGFLPRNLFIQLSPDNPYSTRLPKELQDGEEAIWQIPTGQFVEKIEAFLHGWLAQRFPAVYVKTLKIGVPTSTGAKAERLAEKPLREWYLAKYREFKVKPK